MNTPGASGRGPGNSRGSWGEPRSHQPSVAKAFNEFDEAGRTKPSSYYDRMVDVMEELIRFTILLRPHAQQLVDRHSARKAAGVHSLLRGGHILRSVNCDLGRESCRERVCQYV